jgi:phosphohistidine phosphatase
MKTLLLLRHAKSSWDDPALADYDRTLKKRGKRDATRVGRLLRREGLLPELIVCSSAVRARETAARVVDSSGYEGDVQFRDDLYDADVARYLDVLRATVEPADPLLLVGHNPTLEELVEALTGSAEPLPTAALVHLTLNVPCWRDLPNEARADCVNLWRPRERD